MQDCKRREAKSYAVCYLLVKTSREKFLQKISKTILKSTFPWNASAPKNDTTTRNNYRTKHNFFSVTNMSIQWNIFFCHLTRPSSGCKSFVKWWTKLSLLGFIWNKKAKISRRISNCLPVHFSYLGGSQSMRNQLVQQWALKTRGTSKFEFPQFTFEAVALAFQPTSNWDTSIL